MEISDLLIFSKVAELEGITRAAQALNRVPSNITARIQKLERDLGKTLFIREKNRLRISPAGEQLLGYASKIINLADEARCMLSDTRPTGFLRLGTMEAVAASRLSGILSAYHEDFPEVDLQVSTAPTGALIEQVLLGEMDLAMVADPPSDSRLGALPLFRETLVVVSDRSHDVINSPQDLGNNPTVLGFSSKCAYRTRLTHWVDDAGIVCKVIEINSYHALLNCVAAGMGVGIVPKKLLENYPFAEDLNVHELPEKWQKSVTTLIWRTDSVKASMSAFEERVKKAVSL